MGSYRSLRGFLVDCLSLFHVGRLGGLALGLRLQRVVGSERQKIGLVWGCLLKILLIVILPVFVQCMGLLRIGW